MTDPKTLSPPSLETHVAAHDETFLDSNELVINMGPQHPATHGVLRVILRLDGEKVLGLECVIGMSPPRGYCPSGTGNGQPW